MKKLLIVIIALLGIYQSNGHGQTQYALAGTFNVFGTNPNLLLHLEATLLPTYGFGIRISSEVSLSGSTVQGNIDALYLSPSIFYGGVGFSLFVFDKIPVIQYGVSATLGFEFLLLNSLSVFAEARPAYILSPELAGKIIIPISVGLRLRFIAVPI